MSNRYNSSEKGEEAIPNLLPPKVTKKQLNDSLKPMYSRKINFNPSSSVISPTVKTSTMLTGFCDTNIMIEQIRNRQRRNFKRKSFELRSSMERISKNDVASSIMKLQVDRKRLNLSGIHPSRKSRMNSIGRASGFGLRKLSSKNSEGTKVRIGSITKVSNLAEHFRSQELKKIRKKTRKNSFLKSKSILNFKDNESEDSHNKSVVDEDKLKVEEIEDDASGFLQKMKQKWNKAKENRPISPKFKIGKNKKSRRKSKHMHNKNPRRHELGYAANSSMIDFKMSNLIPEDFTENNEKKHKKVSKKRKEQSEPPQAVPDKDEEEKQPKTLKEKPRRKQSDSKSFVKAVIKEDSCTRGSTLKLLQDPEIYKEEAKRGSLILGNFYEQLSVDNPNEFERTKALMSPIPRKAGVLSLTLIRKNTGFNRLYPKYYLHFTSSNEFLVNAKKRPGNKLSNYLISSKQGEFERKKSSFISKLRAQEGKKKYLIFNNGENFKSNAIISRSKIRNEIGAIHFKKRLMTSHSNNRDNFDDMIVGIPKVDVANNIVEFKPLDHEESMLRMLEDSKYDGTITCFQKKEPEWNEKAQKYYLKFDDRVQKASIKNCQLVKVYLNETIDHHLNNKNNNLIFLQFGRIDDKHFALNIQWPFSIVQGFAIALSIFDQ
ncbi:unnamed protein product [Moneuplotes crassus]|uniref:Tubby C-terminal domain-containing protein n=1 Tax=Euplotes crassus TaxID=5936 RepID=A0AAD1U707_EUPCR|nr:unnamed protein product [Moneuplotes crassus]